ncbi:reprolysin-like metallopeptidase [Bizionia sp.]|uniref:reprolysin-like metallopeptidase n=1 Tax=Bizionia sp. TaxID=1954480 RepID=UPI003A90A697
MRKTTNYYFKKLKLLLLVFVLAFGPAVMAQQKNSYWSKTKEGSFNKADKVHRASQPSKFEVFNLDLQAFKNAIENAPLRSENSRRSNVVVEFPVADGTFEQFMVSESPIMAPGLAERYPMIKTYKAVGIDDPTATMRFSVTQFGLHSMMLSGKRSSVYIDPYTENRNSYMVYSRNTLGEDLQGFECLVDENIDLGSLTNERSTSRADTDDRKLRTYRLAQSCNGEYGQIFAGSGTVAQQKANVQAQMVLTINRVNEIYERDLAITLVFVANNDAVIYLNPATDPWNGEFNTTTAQTLDNVIGVNNYDIGHNFNTSGGGSAGCLGCVCASQSQTNFHKGRGYTGRPDPTGDPFDIDYVAHEMGHQFDGWHSMNTCSRSGNGSTEVEPASGSSIMGYAGICATNVQNNSDAHFNYVNIRDISANIQTGVSSTCDVETDLVNQPPVANAGADYNIPKSTPYVLRGTATDPDGEASLTYNWSQNDPERAPGNGAPQSAWTVGPLYRSILPSDSPNRYMPKLSDVVAGNLTPTWEVTPSVARNMEFSFIVRDNGSGFAAGIGQTDADLMTVTVENVDPFTVAGPNGGDVWTEGATQTVTWNVGQTDNATINCQTVNILLSTDGGFTYPYTLAAATPNDGTEDINVPSGTLSTTARVMVEAADNIFYDISNSNFNINTNDPDFYFVNTNGDQAICGGTSVSYEFDYFAINGFTDTTGFTVSGNPAGSNVVITPNSLDVSGSFIVDVNNLGGAPAGDYTITVSGTSGSAVKNVDVILTLVDGVCASVANTSYQTSTTLVQFNTIDNASGKPSGYSDYTAISTDVNRESMYDLVVNMNTDGGFTCVSTVWIDWNQDCVFDGSEMYDMGSAIGTANGPAANSPLAVTVPADAVLGTTTMRVVTKYSSAATPCQNGHDGEVEDYSVNVLTSLSVDEFAVSEFSVYPNPNNGTFNVKMSNVTDAITITVFDIRGRRVYTNDYKNISEFNEVINIGNVESGMYLLQVSEGSKRTTKKIIVE